MKVLIISNNCFSKSQNMGKTLSSFFSEFGHSEVCQLFFYSSIPDGAVCGDFFRISDYDLVHAKLFGKIGQNMNLAADTTNRLYENEQVQKAYSSFKRNSALTNIARTLLWDIARWNSRDLNQWIAAMNPDCIFFASGDTVFSYKVVWKISKKYNLPIISYICDEFYYGYPAKGLLGEIYHSILKKWMQRVFETSCLLTVICNPLGKLYQEKFGTDCYVLNTGSSMQATHTQHCSKDNCISYLGNLGLNRWKSLVQIGRALDTFNKTHSNQFRLNVYSGETNPKVLASLRSINSIRFMGRITIEECTEKIRASIAVIHTESFDEDDIKRVKYSISTKIADSLASGTCLFAYGSAELASIQYLKENNCAVIATSGDELQTKLNLLLEDEGVRKECIKRALELAREYHNAMIISNSFRDMILKKLDEMNEDSAG